MPRPAPKEFTLFNLEIAAENGATHDELFTQFNISRAQWLEVMKRPDVMQAIQTGRDRGAYMLRQRQYFEAVQNGDARMLMLLGRERLGQMGAGVDDSLFADVEETRRQLVEKLAQRRLRPDVPTTVQ